MDVLLLLLQYACEVEALTTAKKENLILVSRGRRRMGGTEHSSTAFPTAERGRLHRRGLCRHASRLRRLHARGG